MNQNYIIQMVIGRTFPLISQFFSFYEKYNTFVLHYSQVLCVVDSLGQYCPT